MDFKSISIGGMINKRVNELEMDISRIINFLKCSEEELQEMYNAESLDTNLLLRWSKLLEYDFFRIYSQHLILFSPPTCQSIKQNQSVKKSEILPQFRKKIYTQEIIDFILELIETKTKTKLQVINEYNIPKTTLYKWIEKYKK
ncbi:transposase [Chryseobacterium antibioticum]|uniref:Transposase n=1 Tax=Chryseobacterium pyrolae TaxID=2987481 RepID=A0ABT2IDQ9_9FLAO|nr:transposase [Chryseobacterium pyrolae]MCT2406770.1 transposase [Chryseobacterium pyrolae]